MGKIHHGGVEGVAAAFFQRIKIADGAALFHTALAGNRASLEKQGFGQRRFAAGAMAGKRQGSYGSYRIVWHFKSFRLLFSAVKLNPDRDI
jgi:hypothetical protein